jgi:hypothetical protein
MYITKYIQKIGKLTPLDKVLPEKLEAANIVKKFLAFYEARKELFVGK